MTDIEHTYLSKCKELIHRVESTFKDTDERLSDEVDQIALEWGVLGTSLWFKRQLEITPYPYLPRILRRFAPFVRQRRVPGVALSHELVHDVRLWAECIAAGRLLRVYEKNRHRVKLEWMETGPLLWISYDIVSETGNRFLDVLLSKLTEFDRLTHHHHQPRQCKQHHQCNEDEEDRPEDESYGKYNWVGRGITDKIKQAFFPADWDLYKVAGRNGNGAEGGKRVDQELSEWTRLVQLESKPSTIRAHMEKWSPSTLKIIDLFRQKQWIPVDTQVVVGCTSSRVATAIDIVARHFETNRLILIELKTGYDGTFVEYDGHSMLSPFSHLAATPLRFAYLQLTWAWMLWATTFPRRKIRHSDVMVLHAVEGRDPTLHAIPPEFGLAAVDALRGLMTRSSTVPSKRKKTRTMVTTPDSKKLENRLGS